MKLRNIDIIGGGTVSHVRNHLALTAPAYGETARRIYEQVSQNISLHESIDYWSGMAPFLNIHLTKMANAGKGDLETNEDISKLVDKLIADQNTHIIFFNPALVDFEGAITESDPYQDFDIITDSGKYNERLKTSNGEQSMLLWPASKILSKIRKERKDIFLVAFKTTCGATKDEQFLTGLHLLKSNSCNLVLANDTKTRMNMVITPEQARYHVTTDRKKALAGLVDMTMARAKGTFTHCTVNSKLGVPWNSPSIPQSLKIAVDYCIAQGAYKPFNGATVGHFAAKITNDWIATSIRKTNFNNLSDIGLALCQSKGANEIVSFGGKPSVGAQSQRIIFKEHPDAECILHFHCMPKPGSKLSIREQRLVECGSHECGKNTSDGLVDVGNGIKCVYLDNHGPNIIFNKNTNPDDVIAFINQNFDLSKSTDQVDRSTLKIA
jgi:hypothetical protein